MRATIGAKAEFARMNRYEQWRVLTVTYKRTDGQMTVSRTGYGDDYHGALADADQQLRPGKWTRVAISQPSSIVADLRNAGKYRQKGNHKRPGEGEVVTILPPRVHKPRGVEFTDE